MGSEGDTKEESFNYKVKCHAGDAVDCENEMAGICENCRGMFDICKDKVCPEDSENEECKHCKSCEFCKPYAKCPVKCDSKVAKDCMQCKQFTDQCKECEGKMDSDDCAICKGCRVCKPYMECKKEEVDCKSKDAMQCGENCKDCIACAGVETEQCAKCEKCGTCMPFMGCFMEQFCEENKDHDCMKGCKACVGCFDDEMKKSEECALCKECQACKGFGMCMTDGLEGCKPEKVAPIVGKFIKGDEFKKCMEMMGSVDDTLTEEECDCLLAVPENVVEENDCFLVTESLGSMRSTCKKFREDKEKEIDCKSDDAKHCGKECKNCIACAGVETEQCAKCEKCGTCMPYMGCFMEQFCEENKDHDCMKGCKACVGCFDDEMKKFEECALCKECQACKGFGMCMTGGLEGCKPEKIFPIVSKYIQGDELKKC